jgi:hypothetical protein
VEAEAHYPTAQEMYPHLLESLRVLALPANLLYLFREGQLIDDADEVALLDLERFLMRPSKDVTPYMSWSAVAQSQEWDHIRNLAKAALVSLSRPASEKRPYEAESN